MSCSNSSRICYIHLHFSRVFTRMYQPSLPFLAMGEYQERLGLIALGDNSSRWTSSKSKHLKMGLIVPHCPQLTEGWEYSNSSENMLNQGVVHPKGMSRSWILIWKQFSDLYALFVFIFCRQ